MQDLFAEDVRLAVLLFPLQKSYLSLFYWAIIVGWIISFVLWKKHIGTNRWRWVTLFGVEIIALVLSISDGKWGYVAPKTKFSAGIKDYEFARAGVWVFCGQILITLLMCILLHKNQFSRSPKKENKRELCGDV